MRNFNFFGVTAFLLCLLSFDVQRVFAEEVDDVLDDGTLDSLELEVKSSCGSQRAGDAKLFFSSQILDRTEKLNAVLKRKFTAIHNSFRNPYETTTAGEPTELRSKLQLAVENLERLEQQGQSYDQIEAQRSKVRKLKGELDRKVANQTRAVSPERMAHAQAEMKKLGIWADRLDLVQKKAEGCYGFANSFRREGGSNATASSTGGAPE